MISSLAKNLQRHYARATSNSRETAKMMVNVIYFVVYDARRKCCNILTCMPCISVSCFTALAPHGEVYVFYYRVDREASGCFYINADTGNSES